MSSRAVPWLVAGLLFGGVAAAETIVVDGQVAVRQTSVERPSRGSTMSTVEQRFGAPNAKHAAVGQPPITRWDYAGFSVFFEHDRVIHAVVVGG
ncbi:MAG TPA: hypothetical protein PKL49_10575 [Steroidobacteraceae bacterium]|jgi:hypothetical protein|nr:hypothetical protein [Steroidobacteraceae bacterium]HNS27528.1 hypothetical protein [Steroidobacteraceae bacterium]